MKIAHGNIFFVYYLVLFVRSNSIELHHFIILTFCVVEVLILMFFTTFICTQYSIGEYSKSLSPLGDSIGEIQALNYKCFFKTVFDM